MRHMTKDDKKDIQKKVKELDAEALKKYIQDNYSEVSLTAQCLGMIFEKISHVNKQGFSDMMTISELSQIHPNFRTTNGGDWCRSNSGFLGKKYIVKRIRQDNRIFSVQLDGINRNKTVSARSISDNVRKALKDKTCAILDIVSSNGMEIDHKNARYDKRELEDSSSQQPEDFQMMSKAANDAKRQHCARCKSSNKRYDARALGYNYGWTMGDEDTQVCEGCYWFDPFDFNKRISDIDELKRLSKSVKQEQ